MRLPDNALHREISRGTLTLSIGLALAGCVGGADALQVASANTATAAQVNGPSADYPIVIGEPYTIGDVEYVPLDTLNYDRVGYAAPDDGAIGYTGSHHTLPIPSYVEVTALASGRTALIRLERRGPMASNHLLALSPAAMAQLGIAPDAAVRVRRVNPPEDQRFFLRAGEAAPLRMDTPTSLLTVLRRRLPESGAASLDDVTEQNAPTEPAIAKVDVEPSVASQEPEPAEDSISDEVGEVAVAAPQPVPEGGFVVQAASFAVRANADRAAESLGGTVSQAGRFFRVRTGPFATRGEAEASLANIRDAGYTDARIFTTD